MKAMENAALYAVDILGCSWGTKSGYSPLEAVQMAARIFKVQPAHLLAFMRINYSAVLTKTKANQ